jgi:uncharacterized membrane protein required for colicin V production
LGGIGGPSPPRFQLNWPDIVIAIVLVFSLLKGVKRGMIAELTGMVALAFGIAAAFAYTDTFDGFIRTHGHLGPAPTHVVGMLLYAGLAYAIVYVLGAALSSIARLPLLNAVNGMLGAIVGLAKGAVFCWAILYVALLFPLPRDIRGDLHRSRLVATLETPDAWFDHQLRDKIPDFMRPYGEPILDRHRV